MTRGVSGAAIVITTTIVYALHCMRGGRAFVTGCAQGGCNRKVKRLAFSHVRVQSLLFSGSNSPNSGASIRPLRSPVAEAARRRTPHSSTLMALSSSSSAGLSWATEGPVKRHRNTFLLPLQHQHKHKHQRPPSEDEEGTLSSLPKAENLVGIEPGLEKDDRAEISGSSSRNSHEQATLVAALEGDDTDNRPVALVILNAQGEEGKDLLNHLWGIATLRVCADGGANRLHDSFGGLGRPLEERALFVPDVIVGDLDSLRPEVASFYEGLGSEIKLRDDQDHCDFEKCLVEVESRLSSSGVSAGAEAKVAAETASDDGAHGKESSAKISTGARPGFPCCAATVVGLGAFGGRFDHEMQAISLLHAYTPRFHRLVLMGEGNVAFLLEPGRSHTVEPDLRFEGPTVGLIPVGAPCRAVTTEGLRWNLKGQGLEFGVCVSSSNEVVRDVVQVTTDSPLVWTAEFKNAAWLESISCDARG